jgi:Rrf2 family protein
MGTLNVTGPEVTFMVGNSVALFVAMAVSYKFAMAVHAMTLLANGPESGQTSDEIARRINTNPVVVRRLLATLSKTGLVLTRKGQTGGTRLSRPPDQVTLADIYSAVGRDEPFHVPPNRPPKSCPVGRRMGDILERVFTRADLAMQDELRKTTVRDLTLECTRANRRGARSRSKSNR